MADNNAASYPAELAERVERIIVPLIDMDNSVQADLAQELLIYLRNSAEKHP